MTTKLDTAGNLAGVLQKPKMMSWVTSLQEPVGMYLKMLDDLRKCIDIDTANGASLDLIGDIVGQSRSLNDSLYLAFFGYQGQNSTTGYGQARYRQTGEPTLGGVTTLADEEYRRILRWRKDFIRSTGTVRDIKVAMKHIFGEPPKSVSRTGSAEVTISLPDVASKSPYLALTGRFVPAPVGVAVKLTLNGNEVEQQ